MECLARLRRWANRDDGRHYRIGNRPIGALEATGLFTCIAAVALWQLHARAGIGGLWAYIAGAAGFLLTIPGGNGSRGGPDA
ncbi:hypothetical protein [Fulvimonas soli]|jgi:hypothetical protein|uniref:Uncharacterized protein n=1 Tax=Fulvimonas soli TaxID=155197 RepID=A0A316IHH3_9GAMM|nr:hypothetical protein [Fulvimonas soli]PWK86695.1 hypothetical protein C7456_10786 [Fulvimonas soli]TNY25767.1 hypothetical protein BV497_12245 [Fulvimonas soli]